MCSIIGASVSVADEEGDTCLHLALTGNRQTVAINLDSAPNIRQVGYTFDISLKCNSMITPSS